MEIPVIIVTYNSAGTIGDCLRSLQQEQLAGKVTVVDNHSSDNTVQEIQVQFPHVAVIANSENKGYGRAINQVLRACTASHCLLLNPDTHWNEPVLPQLVQAMQQLPDAWCCGPSVCNETGEHIRAWGHFPAPSRFVAELLLLHRIAPRFYRKTFRYDTRNADSAALRKVDYISGAAMLIDVKQVAEAGYFDEDFFLYGEETELAWRMRKRGSECLLVPSVSIIHREGASIHRLPVAEQQLLHRSGMVLFFRKTSGPLRLLLVRLLLSCNDLLRVFTASPTLHLLKTTWS